MGKKIDNKKTKAISPKKALKRQNTMEETAAEGLKYVKNLEKFIKKQQKEKIDLQKKQQEREKKAALTKKAPHKDASSSSSSSASPSPSPSPKKLVGTKKTSSPIKKASSTVKTTIKGGKKAKVAASPVPTIPAPTFTPATPINLSCKPEVTKTIPIAIKSDVESCSDIASTELIHSKLGYQIIKKSLKGQAKAEDIKDDKKKAKPMRTKTGEKLAAGMVDIVFCCDTTGSMGSYLSQCKNTIEVIMKKILEKTSGEGISVKFGFVAYRDHPNQDSTYLTSSYDLTDEKEILQYIGTLNAGGGGDTPEAAMDGLYVSSKYMSWRDSTHIPSLRYIFHIADAPPHGKEFGQGKGCMCGLDINKISHLINMKQIHYRLIDATGGTSLQKTAQVFKEKVIDYEECSISKAAEMDIKISDMIIRELLPDMVEEEI